MTVRIVAFLLRLAAVIVLLYPMPFVLAFSSRRFPEILVAGAPYLIVAAERA